MPHDYAIQGCSEQTALARQDLSCTYLAHHELESVIIIIIIINQPSDAQASAMRIAVAGAAATAILAPALQERPSSIQRGSHQ